MKDRISDKVKEIESYITDLESIMPNSFEEYLEIKTKAACERIFEKIVEAITDLSFIIVKEFKLKIPEEDEQAFFILAGQSIITNKLAQKFKEAKGMRNVIVHEYGEIDDKLVFNSVSNEIIPDSKEFLESVKKRIK